MRIHQPGANKFTQLSDVPNSYLGEANQHLAVNALETGIDFVTGGGGGGDVSKVGTPVNNQVAVWTGDGTIEGDTALTFDTTTNTLTVGALTTAVNNLRYTDNGVGRGDLGFTTYNDGVTPWGAAMEFYNSASATTKGSGVFFIGNSTNDALFRVIAQDGDNVYDQVPLTLTQTGVLTISDSVVVPDEAYGVSWNGSLEVPTKNAVYDKIQTMGGGSVTETEVDFGTTPVVEKTFTITDASITATSKIIVTESGSIGTARIAPGDSLWDTITYACIPATGSFTLFARASGSVVGYRKLFYSYS